MIKLVFPLVFFYLTVNIFSFQSKLDSLVQTGVKLTYNLQLEKAENIFEQVINLYPDRPEGYHYLAQLHLWIYLGNKNKSDYKQCIAFSDISIQKSKDILNNEEDNVDIKYLLAMDYTYRAMVFTSNSKALSAFWSSKNAVSNFKDILEIDSTYYDAYLGLGIFDYALSFVPPFLKWALTLTGLNSNKDQALKFLKIAYNKGTRSNDEAAYYLSQIYLKYLADYDSSAFYLDKLLKKYPKNVLFYYQNALLMIDARKLNNAESALDSVISLNNPFFAQTKSYAYFLLGEVYFKKNEFGKAVKYYNQFLNTTRTINYLGIGNLKVAIAENILGNKNKFLQSLLLARNGNLNIPDDNYAIKMSENLFDIGLSKEAITNIKAKNFVDDANYKAAINLLTNKINGWHDSLTIGMADYIFADANLQLKNYKYAVLYAQKAISKNYNIKKWIIPYSYYFIAEAYYQQGKNKLSKRYLGLAEKNNTFFFAKKLSAKLNNLNKRLTIRK